MDRFGYTSSASSPAPLLHPSFIASTNQKSTHIKKMADDIFVERAWKATAISTIEDIETEESTGLGLILYPEGEMKFTTRLVTLAVVACSMAAAASPSSNNNKYSYSKASFVPPAAPSITKTGWPSAANHPSRVKQQIATGYGTALSGRKKNTDSAGVKTAAVPPVTKNGKIQIKMLTSVPNIGQAGDILFVSSAVFQNQLQKQKKARLISAEEVALIEAEKQKEEEEATQKAIETKKMMEEKMLESLGEECSTDQDICGVALTMKKKAGPEGNLFGGINPKMIMEELTKTFPSGNWEGKQVKLTDMKDSDGNDVKKKDIKHTGEYTCVVKLGSDVDVTFILSVVAEE
jgi:ribosomal protein L9